MLFFSSRGLRLMFLANLVALIFYSCQKDIGQAPSDKTNTENPNGNTKGSDPNDNTGVEQPTGKAITKAHYEWGDLSISPKVYDDVITYNNSGQIEKITTSGQINSVINFTYKDNRVLLDTRYNDIFEFDNQKRVVLHTSTEVQHEMTFVHTQRYTYDANGYLNKVYLGINGTEYTYISYEVKNGNYTRYALKTSDDKITREYIFNYSNTKISTALALFTPVFSNNTLATVEKYLNFGKQSINMLSSVNYNLINLDNTTKSSTLNVQSNLNADMNIIDFKLVGDAIIGVPADNLSPLPRNVSLQLVN
jgi:hypothetical protein